MKLAEWLGFKPYNRLPDVHASPYSVDFADYIDRYCASLPGLTPEDLYREQPHLRTVVGFVARNVASLGMHVYARQNDGGRVRKRLPQFDKRPNRDQTPYELIHTFVADLMLYDAAYILVLRTSEGVQLRNLRPNWIVGTAGKNAYGIATGYLVRFPNQPESVEPLLIPTENVVAHHGYHPDDMLRGTSPIHALRRTLQDQAAAADFRTAKWDKGPSFGSYVSRPVMPDGQDDWSPAARDKFARDFGSKWVGSGGNGPRGVPVLDEGMKLESVTFTAREEQFIEASKLSLDTVAQVYHVNPTMVGQLDNANYSNVREFRRALYGETLGPVVKAIEERWTAFLLPLLNITSDRVYCEFNIESRLRGSFEEQAQVLQTSVGAPWLTVNEARARQNLPAIEGGDELVKPLNVTQNGDDKPVPADDSTQNDEPGAGAPDATSEDTNA